MTTRLAHRPTATAVGGLAALAVLVLALKWLLITAAILAVPFGLWWCIDRARSSSPTGRVAATGPSPGPLAVAPAVLPAQVGVTVTREEDHQLVLARHHRAEGGATPTVAELVSSRVSRGTHRGAYAVEVRLDGARVGELTAAMSARYAHLVRAAEDRRTHARAEAVVSPDHRGLQVVLRLPRCT